MGGDESGAGVKRQYAGLISSAPSPYPTQPPFSRVDDNLNIGDAMDYGQRKHSGSLGDLVLATLRRLEQSGGPGAGGREGRASANSASAMGGLQ